MKHKIVINSDYGGFSLSDRAEEWLRSRGINPDKIERHNPLLIECIETLGKDASGYCASLEIIEIEGDKYQVRDYDGAEWIETPDSQIWIEIK